MQDLYAELKEKTALLDAAIEALRRRGTAKAQAERDYRVALKQYILMERDKGTPVTIISDLCKGDTEIAEKRFARDVAAIAYDAALEAIYSYKLQIRIIDNQISREWGNAK